MELIPVQRKEFKGIAVLVTAENAEEVAEWCSGTAGVNDGGTAFVRVSTGYGHSARTMLAFAGHYIVLSNRRFTVSKPSVFKTTFDPRNREELDLHHKRGQVIAVLVETLAAKNLTYEQDVKTAYENADKIMNIFGDRT